jgi:hypothetical protein
MPWKLLGSCSLSASSRRPINPPDIGSMPATFQSNVPAGIDSRDRAARETQKLARASLRSDMALAEFKKHLDLAAAGKIDPAVQPIALYLFHNNLDLTAIESGSYAPEKVREISVRLNETYDVMNELDKQWRSPSTEAPRQRTPSQGRGRSGRYAASLVAIALRISAANSR